MVGRRLECGRIPLAGWRFGNCNPLHDSRVQKDTASGPAICVLTLRSWFHPVHREFAVNEADRHGKEFVYLFVFSV